MKKVLLTHTGPVNSFIIPARRVYGTTVDEGLYCVGGQLVIFELLLCHGTVLSGKMRDRSFNSAKSSIYSTKPPIQFQISLFMDCAPGEITAEQTQIAGCII